jgi:hypothetical protein
MDLISFILLVLSCAGVTWTFVQSTIMDKIGLRPLWETIPFLKSLFDCSFCTGFHIGIYWGLFCFWLNQIGSPWFYILTIPFASACASFLFERFMVSILELIEWVEKKNKE